MFRRGFKSQCERRSVEIRKTLGLTERDPLKASDLAAHLGVTIWSSNDIADLSADDRKILADDKDDSWLALTLRIDNHHVVIYKPSQSPRRLNSVIMHELAHIILGHELAVPQKSSDGHLAPSFYDQANEDEANWFGGTLLLPRPALLYIRRMRMPDERAKDHYGVSSQMYSWRIRMTGVDYQLAAYQAR